MGTPWNKMPDYREACRTKRRNGDPEVYCELYYLSKISLILMDSRY